MYGDGQKQQKNVTTANAVVQAVQSKKIWKHDAE